MQHFHIAYWASNAAPWRIFQTVEAESAREAIERANPQAAGRYRVIAGDSDRTAGLFRVSLTAGCCELLEVTAFDRTEAEPEESAMRPAVVAVSDYGRVRRAPSTRNPR